MFDYLGAIISRKLNGINERLKYEQIIERVHQQLVDNCTPSDRLDALNDVPTDLENAMHSAWLAKDDLEFMRLFRVQMHQYFETDATELAAYYLETGE
jgi:hypothetical protein